jgi:hypothetical protein
VGRTFRGADRKKFRDEYKQFRSKRFRRSNYREEENISRKPHKTYEAELGPDFHRDSENNKSEEYRFPDEDWLGDS